MTLERDLYDILGIPRTAGRDEIKRAFRKLARIYHPDFNPGDPIAERHFREAQQAYEILEDDERRRHYDRFGMAYFRRSPGSVHQKTPREVFNELIEGVLRKEFSPRRRGEDLRYHVSISLEEAAAGADRLLDFGREVSCLGCRGTGAEGSEGKRPCAQCEGLGELRPSSRFFTFRRPCPRCRASGYEVVKKCTSCAGLGRTSVKDALKVRIPSGVEPGQRLKVRERGNDGHQGGAPGDLYVIVHVRDHDTFRRQGSELLCDVRIELSLAVLGGSLEVPTLQGPARIQVPPGTQPGRMFRLRGMGMPRSRNGGRGDLHVRIQLAIPANLTDEQRRLYEELSRKTDDGSRARRTEQLHQREG